MEKLMIRRCAILLMLLPVCCAILSAQDANKPKRPTDAEISKLVVGKWKQDRKIKETEIKATDDFFKDGTCKSQGTLKRGDEIIKVAMTGTWKISDGLLIQVIETCE